MGRVPETVGVVVNPASGDGDGERLSDDLAGLLAGVETSARVTSGPDDVAAAARGLADSDLLACVGGDGTLREVSVALLAVADPPPVLVVPAGRGNSTYRHLYGEADWREVARAVAGGYETAPYDVGVVSAEPTLERRFVLGFSAGLFRHTVVHAGRLSTLPGRLAYLLGTAGAVLGGDPVHATLSVDGERVFAGETRLVAVGGGRYRGGEFELFPASRPGDGRVHAVAVEPVGAREAVGVVRRAREGRLGDHPAVQSATGERAVICAETGVPVEVDGTPVDTRVTRARVRMHADGLRYARPTDTTVGEPGVTRS